ncbi:MAG: glycerol-3-phosphate acyltransferase, partial [Pseudomonadota bacterium]
MREDIPDGASLLIIVDAAHAVERTLLEQWIDDALPTSATVVGVVALSIARTPETIDATPLLTHLTLDDSTVVLPLRVVWTGNIARNAKPKIWDVMRGDSRRPSETRARRLLAKDRSAASCIAARPASLRALRDKLRADGGDDSNQGVFAAFIADQAGIALDIAERKLRGGRYKVPRRV